MAERAGAAVHVDLFMRQAQIAHRDHRDIGEGFVDLEQIDVVLASSPRASALFSIAPTGAVVNQRGSPAWLACATMRATGFSPRFGGNIFARASTSAAAPSEIDDEFAAVTVPSFAKAGLSVGIFAGSARRGCSSVDDLALAALARDLHADDFGRERRRRPARASRACSDSVAKASWSARVN